MTSSERISGSPLLGTSSAAVVSDNVILRTDVDRLGYTFVPDIPLDMPNDIATDLIRRATNTANELYAKEYAEYQKMNAAAELLIATNKESPSSIMVSGQSSAVSKQPESSSAAKTYSKFTTAEIWKLVTCVPSYVTNSGIDWSGVAADANFKYSNRTASKLKDKWYDLIKRATNNKVDYIHTQDVLAQVRQIAKELEQKQKKSARKN